MPITLTRHLLVIIIPGVVATAPWLLIVGSQLYKYTDFYEKYSLLVNARLFTFVVIVGSLFEGMNTRFEVKWDKKREEEYDVEKNWYDYLALICNAEPVGFGYISRLVTSMYFELSMMWASVSFGIGVIVLLAINSMPCWGIILTALPTIGAPVYFWWQAKDSHKVLCRARKELNARLLKH